MKLKLTLSAIALIFATILFGQSSSALPAQLLSETPELRKVFKLPDSVYDQYFYRSYGVHGDAFVLGKNKTFDFYRGMYVSYNGRWETDNKGLFYLNSSKKPSLVFFVITFKHYYYLIPEFEKEAFIRRFLLLKDKHKNDKPVELEGRVFSAEDNLAIDLGGKNFWINGL